VAEAIRFYMDEHVHKAVVEGLRRRGVDVLRAQEAGLMSADDPKHLALAAKKLEFTNNPEATKLLHFEPRKGWEL